MLDRWLSAVAEQIAHQVAERLKTEPALQSSAHRTGPRLMTVEQAASYLGRTKEAVQHMIHAGKLPTVRSDRRVFLDRFDLDQWIGDHKNR